MTMSKEERAEFLARVQAEDAEDRKEAQKAQEFKDIRTSVKLLNNIILTQDPNPKVTQEGILFQYETDAEEDPEQYTLEYDGKEALNFIEEIRADYLRVKEDRQLDIDDIGITLMLEFLSRNILLTHERGDTLRISEDRVRLFREDIRTFADVENQ